MQLGDTRFRPKVHNAKPQSQQSGRRGEIRLGVSESGHLRRLTDVQSWSA
jgi:hypothetical protein